MKDRCNNKRNRNYKYYGGKNIKVCNDWQKSYLSFKNWAISNGYKENLTIDRIDNNGDYEPNNCRWVDMYTQVCNQGLRVSNTSGYKGVSWHKQSNKWRCHIRVKGKQIYLGKSLDKKELARKYDRYIIENKLPHITNF